MSELDDMLAGTASAWYRQEISRLRDALLEAAAVLDAEGLARCAERARRAAWPNGEDA